MMLLSESEFTEFENFQNVDSVHLMILWILIYYRQSLLDKYYKKQEYIGFNFSLWGVPMLQTIEAVLDKHGYLQLSEPIELTKTASIVCNMGTPHSEKLNPMYSCFL